MYKDHTQNNDDDIMKKIVTNQIIKTVTVMYIPLTKYRYIPEEISHQTLVEVIILSQG